jgi:integrase/recombinase XerD
LVALLQLGCGLRLTEALQLRLADLRLAEAYLVVGGAHAREIPIPALVLEPLHRFVQVRLCEGRTQTPSDAYLFIGQRSRRVDGGLAMKPLPAVSMRRAFRAVQPYVAPHALRQCYAIGELDRGVNLLVVHQRLGQRDLHTTLAYQSLSTRGPASVRSPADQLTGPEEPPPPAPLMSPPHSEPGQSEAGR